ncbi:MAG: DUF2190 family protein [Candidatus Daviesbacteria bacterium]|nr:DUF2190 family protein [Candidatus Daviesbacteria bacterium]
MKRFIVYSLWFIVFCFVLLFTIHHTPYTPLTHAQTPPIDITAQYDVPDTAAIDGDILMYTSSGLKRADVIYAPNIFGVFQDKPLLIYHTADDTGKPVVRAGIADVSVINAGGAIKKGDYITSSPTAGKGQKADQSGYVLGIALQDMSEPSGKIQVAVRIEYAELSNTRSVLHLLDAFNIAAFQTASNPQQGTQLIKYGFAGLIVILSLILSIILFARSITKSIEALGRNPLARSSIMLSIMINAGLTVVTIIIGVVAAFVLLKL